MDELDFKDNIIEQFVHNTQEKLYGVPTTDVPETQQATSDLKSVTLTLAEKKWTLDPKSEGKINSDELQNAFQLYQGKNFSNNVCKVIVRLFDLDKRGGIDIKEFEQLYFTVKQWVTAFNMSDKGEKGYLKEAELDNAFRYMEMKFTPNFITFLIERSDPVNKTMPLNEFIVACVQMQKLSEFFVAKVEKSSGVIELKYCDYLELLMKTR